MTKNMELLVSYIQDLECDVVTQICKDLGIIGNDKIEKSCINCKRCDMCAFKLKEHYKFSHILRKRKANHRKLLFNRRHVVTVFSGLERIDSHSNGF